MFDEAPFVTQQARVVKHPDTHCRFHLAACKLIVGKTVIAIAHRHEDLLDRGGVYASRGTTRFQDSSLIEQTGHACTLQSTGSLIPQLGERISQIRL